MKKYPHAVQKLFYEPLIITPARHAALCQILEGRMRGDMPPMAPDEMGPDDCDGELDIRGATAVIPVHGVITAHASDIPASSCGCGLDIVSQQAKAARAEPGVERIVFHFRTPGGGVVGTPECARLISSIKDKETIAYSDDECSSAGVWLASQCNRSYTMSSASVGSIGVWCAYLDLTKQMAMEGVGIKSFQNGKYKLLGAYWKTMTPDEERMIQASVDKIGEEFRQAVLLNRELPDDYMQGQIFNGDEACEIGLCDGTYESLDELVDDLEEG